MSDNLTIRKTIRLNKYQVENWNPRNVRLFLIQDQETVGQILMRTYKSQTDSQTRSQTNNLLEKLYNLMSNKMEFTEKPNGDDVELIKSVKEEIT